MAREVKSKNTAATSQVVVASALTKLIMLVFPGIDPEIMPFISLTLASSLGWIGSAVRDLAHAYETREDAVSLHWAVKWLIGLLG